MKKVIKFCIVLLSLVVSGFNSSCTNDNTKEYEKLIVGRWQFDNAHKQMDAITLPIWQFAPGGTCIIYDDGGPFSGTYVINGNKLSLSIKNSTVEFNIVNLDNNYLELDEINSDGTFGDRYFFTRITRSVNS